MAHPEVLVEEDHEGRIRWITVGGRHLPFIGAAMPLAEAADGFGEDSPPEHPKWVTFDDSPEGYTAFLARRKRNLK